MELNRDIAAQFMTLTLGHLTREYPHKLDHVLNDLGDALPPSSLHPIFFGSFDWHSCVHGYWQVLRLARIFPDLAPAAKVRALAQKMFTPANIAAERGYLQRSGARGFERPYGWAWALALHQEIAQHDAQWAEGWDGFARDYADRFADFLPKLTYPLRVGTHFNIAFALTLALGWARQYDTALANLITDRAVHWFGNDQDCQAWEPGGDEFLSPALSEAMLMGKLLSQADFAAWFDAFLPRFAIGEPASLFTPATVSDRSDGKIAHLDGLNLSRTFNLRQIAAALPKEHPALPMIARSAKRHLAASLPHVAGDYMGEHWLATFALLAMIGAEA